MTEILKIDKKMLDTQMSSFLGILSAYPEEYWDANNFLLDLPGKWEHSFCCFKGDELLGYIIVSQKQSCYHIHKMMVKNELRGKGIGNKLMTTLLSSLKSSCKISLKVFRSNTSAISFYSKYGFKVCNYHSDYAIMELEN